MLKAEYCGVQLSLDMKGFPTSNFEISSDQERIQQVVLNLLSNGIKFTQSGGSVKIECTYITSVDDLHHKDHVPFFISSNG